MTKKQVKQKPLMKVVGGTNYYRNSATYLAKPYSVAIQPTEQLNRFRPIGRR